MKRWQVVVTETATRVYEVLADTDTEAVREIQAGNYEWCSDIGDPVTDHVVSINPVGVRDQRGWKNEGSDVGG